MGRASTIHVRLPCALPWRATSISFLPLVGFLTYLHACSTITNSLSRCLSLVTGTADSILKQILAVNPSWVGGTKRYQYDGDTSPAARGLEARQQQPVSEPNTRLPRRKHSFTKDLHITRLIQPAQVFDCDRFPHNRAQAMGVVNGINSLYALAADDRNDICCLPPSGCAQLTCFGNPGDFAAIFGCSRTGGQVCVRCDIQADITSGILGRCEGRDGRVGANARVVSVFSPCSPCSTVAIVNLC